MRSQEEIRRSLRSIATFNTYGYTTYFISIHKHQVKDFITKAEIDGIIIRLKWMAPSLHIQDSAYELGNKYNQLHYHALVTVKSSFRYKTAISIAGYRIYWKKVIDTKDIQRISTYIHKTVSNRFDLEQVLECNFYLHNYAF